jgi:hypothetical protein
MAGRCRPLLLAIFALLCVVLSAVGPTTVSPAPGVTLGTARASAAGAGEGLLITPIRQFLSVDAGKSIHSTFTVGNLTGSTLNVHLAVKQFSVTNYAYSYTFSQPGNDWLHLSTDTVAIAPGQNVDIPYSLDVPSRSPPGGRYYTLLASATASTKGVASTIQAADLLYLTVNGKLTTVSHLVGSSIHWVSFGHDVDFGLKPINTGNVYSFVYVSGQLHGLFVKPAQTSTAHLLMPGKVRNLSGSIPAPVLPGVYKATYGYKTDAGWVVQQEHWVVFIPPWFIAFVLAALLFGGKFLPRLLRRRHVPEDKTD